MIQRRLPVSPETLQRHLKTRRRRDMLRALETLISVAVSMTPVGLVAYSAISGA